MNIEISKELQELVKTLWSTSTRGWKDYVGDRPCTVEISTWDDDQCHVLVAGGRVLRFTLTRYPSCCGAVIFHNFVYNTGLEAPKNFDEFMTAVLKEIPYNMFFKNRRLIGVAVESLHSYSPELHKTHNSVLYIADPRENPLISTDFPPNENPKISEYPLFYEFFRKQRKFSERLFYNCNSGNVCHEFEVVL